MENKVNQNLAGLNLDNVNWQVKENMVTYALNANIQSHDGESLTYSNEPSNQPCYDFDVNKPGYKIVGHLPIIEQDKLIVFLTDTLIATLPSSFDVPFALTELLTA